LKKLLPYLKPYKIHSILGPLFKLLEASFELIIPLVVAAIIDTGIQSGNKRYIIQMCGILALLGLVGMISSITAQWFAAKASVGFAAKIRYTLFSHIQTLSFSKLDTLGASTLITRLTSDVNQVQSGLNLTLRLLLRSPFVVFGAMIMAFTIDVPSAMIFVVTIPLLCLVVFGIMLITMPLYKKVQTKLELVLGNVRQSLSGARTIRAFRMEDDTTAAFQTNNEELTKLQQFVGKLSALMNPITYIIINGAIIILIYTGAIRVETGLITQGALVALYNYMTQILVELVKMANMIISLTKAVASAKRLSDIMNTESEQSFPSVMESSAQSPVYAVEMEHVFLRYPSAGDDSLTDISFRVKPGETIGIIGPTGSGKTSLVHLLPRFYDATAGTIRIFGKDIRAYPMDQLRKKFGFVPQKALLFHGTIRDNLLWGNENAGDTEILKAAEIAQAGDILSAKGLDAVVEQEGRNLSGGQKQRLTIARALVRCPEILVLDDSASALDMATDARLRKALAALPYKPTIFIVSQRTASLRHADKILVLEDGELVGIGTHDTLMENCLVYREIHMSQSDDHSPSNNPQFSGSNKDKQKGGM